ncbi:MAG: signal peptide peptidase SppA [Candidatus Kapaibacterium sp.]|nr:signal peptide peptidase SppA [Bacteroidota bacterium]
MTDNQQPQYTPPQKVKSKWLVPLYVLLSLIGGMFLFVIIMGVGFASFIGGIAGSMSGAEKDKAKVEENSILYLNFPAGVQEYVAAKSGFFSDDKSSVSLLDVLTAIKAAKDDPKIKGIYYKPGAAVGFAKQREIIAAIEDFKKSGKFYYAYMPGGAERDYYFAALADSIFLPQESMFEMNGFGSSTMFMKNMFEKLGIEWTVVQREEYKSAGETFSRTGYSDPARQEVRELLNQRYQYFVNDVARYRKLSTAQVSSVLQRGVYDPDSLRALGFVDAFLTELQFKEFLKKKIYGNDVKNKKLHLVGVETYANNARLHNKSEVDKDKAIAIIYGTGAIRSGKRGSLSDVEIASGSWVRDLRKAADDDKIKAIILRIDSPGGSVQASDEMYQEIVRAKAKKPVYASMSDVAASGGYYMAMACDTIFAYPETITGSIGVIAMIPNASKTMDKLGITVDTITSSRSALFMDPTLPLTDADKKHLDDMIGSFYSRFLERVAEGRKSTPEKIREVAKGRVWTGEAAKQNGLVDVLGGLYTTIDAVKKRIGVAANKRVSLVTYPEKEDEFEVLMKLITKKETDEDGDDDAEEKAQTKANLKSAVEQYVQAQNPAWQQAWKQLPEHMQRQFAYTIQLMNISKKEQAIAALPWLLEIQ